MVLGSLQSPPSQYLYNNCGVYSTFLRGTYAISWEEVYLMIVLDKQLVCITYNTVVDKSQVSILDKYKIYVFTFHKG